MYTERKTCLLFLQQRWNNSIGELRLRSIFLPQNIFGSHENCFFYFRHFQFPIFRSYRYVKSHQKNSHPNSCNLHVDFSPCKRKYSEKIIFKHQHICLVKISMKKTASEFTSFGEKIEKL